ncbi:MAG: inositol monophosphatase family protein [Rhabdochlamydiaceae bacterium]|nr:inositol monophosphatase family protein [Candidatus Amphrikana amoebophyrae]
MNHSLSELSQFSIELALEAGRILKEGYGSSFSIKTKSGRHDLVTDYDYKAEEYILSAIKKKYPKHGVLSEEAGSLPSSDSEVLWIIDPLDGTVNFAHSIPMFATSIAASFKGELICGAIFNPITNELFSAQKGHGSFLNKNKITVSATDSFEHAFLATGFPYNIETNPEHCIEHLNHILSLGIPLRRIGSAAIDLAYIAAGRFDAFWEVVLHPWDFAAGALIIEEAGGKVTQMKGEPLVLTERNTIAASNFTLHNKILTHLRLP